MVGHIIPSGHPQADASNLINNTHTLANYSIAYGTLVDDYLTPDLDVYSLGELYQGLYVVDVDDFTWDFNNIDIGSVSKFMYSIHLGHQFKLHIQLSQILLLQLTPQIVLIILK